MDINVNINLKEIKKNWEKVLFWMMLAISFVLFITFFVSLFFYDDPAPNLNVTGTSQKSLFGENAFAFLYGVPVLEEEESPFNLKKAFPKEKYQPPPKHVNTVQPPPKPKPKPLPEGHIVMYNGWLNVATGEKIAFIKILDLRSKNLLKSDTIQVGGTIQEYKIDNIDDEKIVIEDNKGNKHTIPIYKETTIIKNE